MPLKTICLCTYIHMYTKGFVHFILNNKIILYVHQLDPCVLTPKYVQKDCIRLDSLYLYRICNNLNL